MSENKQVILGIDEVGRGPWAGPLVVGACILPPRELPDDSPDPEQAWQDQLTDSKKLTAKRRESLSALILANATVGLGWVHANELDQVGLSAALKLATRRAVQNLKQSANTPMRSPQSSTSESAQKPNPPTTFTEIIIDGTINFLAGTPLEMRVTTIKKADLLIKEVSAASIVAKVARDHYMVKLAEKYPGYGFEKHVGYGTAAHRAALLDLGPTPEHRHSFKPVAKYGEGGNDGNLVGVRSAAARSPLGTWERSDEAGSAARGARPLGRELPKANGTAEPVDGNSIATSTTLGHRAESLVADHLIANGHTLIAKNHKTKHYEIDLITTKDHNIYFTEVKYRKSATHGSPFAAITKTKQHQMSFAAESFLKYAREHHLPFASYQPLLAAASVSGPDFHLDQWITLSE